MPPDGINTKLIYTNTLLDTLSTTAASINSDTSEIHTDVAALAVSVDNMYDALNTLSAFIQLAVGTFSEAEPGTILATLRQMAICVCAAISGLSPVGTAPNGCDEPLASLSDRLLTDDDFPGRAFVEWDSVLPQGVELSNDVYPELPTGIELHLTGDSTYYIWVQSTCDTFRTTPDSASEYPTNAWVSIDGPNTIAVNLAVGCAAKAFLCIDPELGFVDCITRGSLLGSADYVDESDTHFPGTPQYIPLDGIGGTTDQLLEWDSVSLAVGEDWHILYINAQNWTFQKLSGNVAHLGMIGLSDDDDHHENWTSSGDDHTYTVTIQTRAILIDNAVGGPGDPEQPFTMRICPPSPG